MADNPIQILFSPTTTNTPSLGVGATDNNIGLNGPDEKLFYFNGTVTKGANLAFIESVTAGTLTADKALVVDSSSKIDVLNVDNLTLNGNTLSSTDTDGDVIISPNGTGDIDAATSTIKNVVDPTAAQDAATKAYVDSVAVGLLDFKNSVRVISTSDIDLGVAADPSPVDGVTLADGDRILLAGQSSGEENGIYDTVTATDPTTWVRSEDANISAEVTAGMFMFVVEGTANADTGWVLSTNDTIILDTTALTFVQFSVVSAVIDGAGLVKTGNVLDVVGTASRITVNANDIDIASDYVGQTSITTLGTIGTGTWEGTAVALDFGGTGTDLTGVGATELLRMNAGQTALEAAVLDTDYIDPNSLVGGETF